MCQKGQRLIFLFCFLGKLSHSQDIHIFIFLTISWFIKSVTSWWILVRETDCIFKYIFWTTTEVTELRQLIDMNKHAIIFQESFEQFPGPFQFSNFAQLLNNHWLLTGYWLVQSCQDSNVSFFWKGEKRIFKNDKCQLLKMVRSRYIIILIKS